MHPLRALFLPVPPNQIADSGPNLQSQPTLKASPTVNVPPSPVTRSTPRFVPRLKALLSSILNRNGPRPNALSSSVLSDIPPEIILYIVDFLPSESAAAFSLSCIHFKQLFGTQHLSRVASSSEAKLALLNLLASDLPDQIACLPCKRLHKMKNLQRYNSATWYLYADRPHPICVKQDRRNDTDLFISGLFGMTACKMAIKRHHQQPECTELLQMMSTETVRTWVDRDWILQPKEECRVVRGHLLQRVQIAFAPRRVVESPDLMENLPGEKICRHLRLKTQLDIDGAVWRCQKCHTDYHAAIRNYGKRGWIIVLTRWKDLGCGPDCKIWKEHHGHGISTRIRECFTAIRISGATSPSCNPLERSIAHTFEDGNDSRFETLLTTENEDELFRTQERWRIHNK